MALQTTYSTQTAARAGQLADMQESYNAFSRTVETSAGIGFGVPVQRGAADGGAKAIGDGSATTFLGVSLRTQSRDANNPDKFAQYESVRILDKGVVWVVVAHAVAPGDAVYYKPSTGAWTNEANDGAPTPTSYVQVANAVWDSTAANAGYARLRLK